MSKREKIALGLIAAMAGTAVLVTVATPPEAKKGSEDIAGVWVYEESVDSSTCESEPVGTKRGLLLTVQQGPPAKSAASNLRVVSDGPTQYSTYKGSYNLASSKLEIAATAGKKNISSTSTMTGKLKGDGGNRIEGTRNVKVVVNKNGKQVSSCKILASFTARRL